MCRGWPTRAPSAAAAAAAPPPPPLSTSSAPIGAAAEAVVCAACRSVCEWVVHTPAPDLPSIPTQLSVLLAVFCCDCVLLVFVVVFISCCSPLWSMVLVGCLGAVAAASGQNTTILGVKYPKYVVQGTIFDCLRQSYRRQVVCCPPVVHLSCCCWLLPGVG